MYKEKNTSQPNPRVTALEVEILNLKNELLNLKKEYQTLKEENTYLNEENQVFKERETKHIEKIDLFTNILNKTKTIIFNCDFLTNRALWNSGSKYFINIFGKDYLKSLNIFSRSFIDNIHPEDKENFMTVKSEYLKQRKSDEVSLLFRMKSKSNDYKWLLLKSFSYDDNINKQTCLYVLTDFNNNTYNKKQIYGLNKELRREENKEIIDQIEEVGNNLEETLQILKYLIEGKTQEKVMSLLNLKNPSVVENIVDRMFDITKTKKIAALAFRLGQLDIL